MFFLQCRRARARVATRARSAAGRGRGARGSIDAGAICIWLAHASTKSSRACSQGSNPGKASSHCWMTRSSRRAWNEPCRGTATCKSTGLGMTGACRRQNKDCSFLAALPPPASSLPPRGQRHAPNAALFAQLPEVQDLQCARLARGCCCSSVPPFVGLTSCAQSLRRIQPPSQLRTMKRCWNAWADQGRVPRLRYRMIPPASAQRAHLLLLMGGLGLPSASGYRRRWRTCCARCSGRHLPCRPAPGRPSAQLPAGL